MRRVPYALRQGGRRGFARLPCVDVIAWFRRHPDHDILKSLFTLMARQAIGSVGSSVPLPADLQEMRTMLETQGERWIRKWKAEGKAEVLIRLLGRRFGPLPAAVAARVERADVDEVDAWTERLLDAPTLDAVFAAGVGAAFESDGFEGDGSAPDATH